MYCCFKIIVKKNEALRSGLVSKNLTINLSDIKSEAVLCCHPEIGNGIIKLESGVVGEYNWGKIVSAITEDCL